MSARFGPRRRRGAVALELALAALDIGPGDEVIVPAYTFVATASSVVFSHGVPVFVDVDLATHNVDVSQLESISDERTGQVGHGGQEGVHRLRRHVDSRKTGQDQQAIATCPFSPWRIFVE